MSPGPLYFWLSVSYTHLDVYKRQAYNRVKALRKNKYDMVITSYMTAKNFLAEYSELEIAMTLNECLYSKEYVIVVNSPNVTSLKAVSYTHLDVYKRHSLDWA